MNKKIAGFTLIEMLVVVAIIAILASVFLIGLRGFRGSAYDSRRLSDLQKVQSYLELYYNQNRAYPNASDWGALEDLVAGASLGINALPNDPIYAGGNGPSYQYAVTEDLQSYVLGATLSDVKSAVLSESQEIDTVPDGFSGIDCVDPNYCIQF